MTNMISFIDHDIQQDAYLSLVTLAADHNIDYHGHNPDHDVYFFVIEGQLQRAKTTLKQRDALGVWNTAPVKVKGQQASFWPLKSP